MPLLWWRHQVIIVPLAFGCSDLHGKLDVLRACSPLSSPTPLCANKLVHDIALRTFVEGMVLRLLLHFRPCELPAPFEGSLDARLAVVHLALKDPKSSRFRSPPPTPLRAPLLARPRKWDRARPFGDPLSQKKEDPFTNARLQM